jgi:hypothetical protein
LRVKAQLLERLQRVNVADGATHFPKDDAEGSGGPSNNGAEVFVLFLCSTRLGF